MSTQIETLCIAKEKELLEKYFGNLVKEAAHDRPETIGDYTVDLPHKIENEYREFLKTEWAKISDPPLVLEEQKLRTLSTEADRESIEKAYKDAKTRTLWERITNSNHTDVTYYKGLLYKYTTHLLSVMRIDFLEEITGNHITCKAFKE